MPFGTHIAFLYGCATYANILDVVTQFQSVPVTLHLYGLVVSDIMIAPTEFPTRRAPSRKGSSEVDGYSLFVLSRHRCHHRG